MEIKATVVFFNSTPENFEKEQQQKNCTVRKLSKDDEKLLKKSRIKWVSIRNEETGESLLRPIADITPWDGRYIFTWVPYDMPQPAEFRGLERVDNNE